MKSSILTLILLFSISITYAQLPYTKVFGDSTSKPLIFLHGGPGSNAGSFELTTAQEIADMGYFVILYDRRGEGRSADLKAKYTFRQTFDDLNDLYKRFGIKRATLIGYSFGGLLATLYAEKYSDKVSSLVLVSSLLSLQDTYAAILDRSGVVFREKHDTADYSNYNRWREWTGVP